MNFHINTNEDWLIYSDYLEENNQLDKADFIRNQLDDIEPSWDYEYGYGSNLRISVGGVGIFVGGVGGGVVGWNIAVGGGVISVGDYNEF